jgi:hypothetical protein
MAREKKLQAPITLFAAIEEKQHEALCYIGYKERRSIADVVREAISQYIKSRGEKRKAAGG